MPLLSAGVDLEALKFFENKVRPLLAAECYECHGSKKSKGSLRLDHISFIRKGGETGPAIAPGDPANSLMIEAIHQSDSDFSMPPKKKLSSQEIAVLENWIKMGAPWPDEVAEGGEVDQNGFTQKDYQWWAVQPVKDPASHHPNWHRNGPRNEN